LSREFGPVGDANSGALNGKRWVKQYSYNDAGQLVSLGEGTANADLSAVTITRYCALAYDPWRGSVVEKRFSDGRRIRYAYLDNGLLQRVEITSGPADTLIYSRDLRYDPNTWRLAGVTSPEGWIEYEHNDYGQVGRIRTSTGQDTEYVYDQMGNLSLARIRGLTASSGQSVVQYQYYGDTGRRKKVICPNATTTEYQYDARGGVSQIKHTGAAGNLATFDYTRDRRGVISQLVETRGTGGGQNVATWTYAYDAQKRLRVAQRTKGQETVCYGYDYDAAGNRTRQTITGSAPFNYTYNERDQLTADGATTFVYDDYGNLCEEREGATTRRRYSWDGSNELVRASLYGAGGALEHTVAFAYDDQGTRIGRAYDSDVTRYLTDYENLTGYSQTLAELDATATSTRQQYSYGDSLLSQSGPSASPQYFHSDHLGSTRLLTTSTGDAISGSDFEYSPYGELIAGTGSLTSARFTGQHFDSDLSLQYHRARWYSPVRAGWLSVDPVTDFPANFASAYGYVGDDPLNRWDRMGLFSVGELNVSSAIQGILTQVVLPDVVTAMVRTVFAAAGVDLSFIISPIINMIANAMQLDTLIDRLAGFMESNAALIDKLVEIVRIVTIVGFCMQTAQTVFSIVRFFLQRGLSAAMNAIEEIWAFVVALQGLNVEFEVSYNPSRRGGIALPLLSGFQQHHILTRYGNQANTIMLLLSRHGLGDFDLKNDVRNVMSLPGHRGRHTITYHRWVYNAVAGYLKNATPGQEQSVLTSALEYLANDLRKNPWKIRMNRR